MLGRYRGILCALVGLALLCGVYSPNEGRAAQSPAQNAEQAQGGPASITPHTKPVATPSPAGNLPSPARDQSYYDREDLKAQRDMAKWTRAMGITAVIGTIVGVVGIGLVFVTFRETRRTAQIAQDALAHSKDMAEVELRPYVQVDEITFEPVDTHGHRSVVVRVKNFGSTPAMQFRIEAGASLRNTGKINPVPNIPLRRYPSVDEIPPGHSAVIRIPGVPKGSYLVTSSAYFCSVKFHYLDKFGTPHMRWETYRANDVRAESGAFRFFCHNHS